MTAKTLVIGLDGADWTLMSRLFQQGLCPNLSQLFEAGLFRQLVKPMGWSDDAVWSSFATGTSMGEHGRYHGPHQYYPDAYRPIEFAERPMEPRPFWEALDKQGYKCALIDVPKCPLASPMKNGFQISDWLVHGPDLSEPVSSPPTSADEIVAKFGAPPGSPCKTYTFRRGQPFHPGFTDEEARHWLAELDASVQMKENAALHYLAKEQWDLFICVFKEAHCVSHLFWDDADSGHPDHDTQRIDRRGRTVEKIYQRIDESVGRLLELAKPYDSAIVFSPHGMQSSFSATSIMEPLVERINQQGFHWTDRVARLGRRGLRALARRENSIDAEFRNDFCFPIHYNELGGAIRINLIGREPSGRINPGAEYENYCDYISDIFYALRDSATGIPIVSKVIRMQQQNDGPRADNLPDLLAIWQTEQPVTKVTSPDFGTLPLDPRRIRPGNHSSSGFCIMTGRGTSTTGQGGAVSIDQLAREIAGLTDMGTVRRKLVEVGRGDA